MDYKLVELTKRLKADGSSQDEILKQLRQETSNIVDAIAAIKFAYDIGLGQAKDIVSMSPHWIRIHEANAPLHDILEQMANQKNVNQITKE